MTVIEIGGVNYSFDRTGWTTPTRAPEVTRTVKLLNQLFDERYGSGSVIYPLTVEALHVKAVVKLFNAKVVREPEPEPIDPEVVY